MHDKAHIYTDPFLEWQCEYFGITDIDCYLSYLMQSLFGVKRIHEIYPRTWNPPIGLSHSFNFWTGMMFRIMFHAAEMELEQVWICLVE